MEISDDAAHKLQDDPELLQLVRDNKPDTIISGLLDLNLNLPDVPKNIEGDERHKFHESCNALVDTAVIKLQAIERLGIEKVDKSYGMVFIRNPTTKALVEALNLDSVSEVSISRQFGMGAGPGPQEESTTLSKIAEGEDNQVLRDVCNGTCKEGYLEHVFLDIDTSSISKATRTQKSAETKRVRRNTEDALSSIEDLTFHAENIVFADVSGTREAIKQALELDCVTGAGMGQSLDDIAIQGANNPRRQQGGSSSRGGRG